MVTKIETAMQSWIDAFGIDFVPRTSEASYLHFQPSSTGCFGAVGKGSGARNISLRDTCSTGNVRHEIGHILGLEHSQNRCDRDLHVKVWEDRIDSDYLYAFDKECNTSHWDVAWWDSQSLMHYHSFAFPAAGVSLPTMTLADGVTTFSSQREVITQGDLQALRELYYYKLPANQLIVVLL
jgi:hypothetical protein